MIKGFYSSASGLMSQQSNMNVIANNVSNISTTAFKPQQANFSALLYENINGGDGKYIQSGSGARIEKTSINFNQGGLVKTDMPMDCAIVGDGFFSTQGKTDDAIGYTRDGNFQISAEDSGAYLVNSTGDYILTAEGEKIDIKGGFDPSKIGVFSFSNKYGLELAGGNKYKATEQSGEATALETSTVKSGYLENSGVEISAEMVKMMEASKGFSFNAKILQTADEMEKIINQLR